MDNLKRKTAMSYGFQVKDYPLPYYTDPKDVEEYFNFIQMNYEDQKRYMRKLDEELEESKLRLSKLF